MSEISSDKTQLNQPATVIWMTGLSGAGKSTLAKALKNRLQAQGERAFVLDGDVLRQGINAGLGFSEEDRNENMRRTAEVARILSLAGVVPIVALISPYAEARGKARTIIGYANFIEVFVHCPLEVVKQRDPKGLYAQAAKGELKNFTGIDSAYEAPEQPNVEVRTDLLSLEECTEMVLQALYFKLPASE